MQNFGERLKYFRKSILRMTRAEFCEKFEITNMSVRGWECLGVNISKRQQEKLATNLKSKKAPVNLVWLLTGIGDPYFIETIPAKSDEKTLLDDEIFNIDNFFYEPLLKKGSIIICKKTPIKPTEVSCPQLVLAMDCSDHLHFGILSLTADKKYTIEAFQGTFYRLVPDETYSIYIIKEIKIHL
jgi:hypothetical protein